MVRFLIILKIKPEDFLLQECGCEQKDRIKDGPVFLLPEYLDALGRGNWCEEQVSGRV